MRKLSFLIPICCLFSITVSKESNQCPLANGVICENKDFCCPESTVCISHDQRSFCAPILPNYPDNLEIARTVKIPYANNGSYVECPDRQTTCADGQSCCQTSAGYACCPYKNGVCCSDGEHCCPEKTACDTQKNLCVSLRAIPWMVRAPEINRLPHKSIAKLNLLALFNIQKGTICPDKTTECSKTATCCLLEDMKYGCCPMPEAVCCSDGLHCCPKSTNCDLQHQSCSTETVVSSVIKLLQASNNGPEPKHQCPDKTSCNDFTTCCKTHSGAYGCCHYTNATCCDDMEHCCPEGYTCSTGENKLKCIKKTTQSEDSPPRRIQVQMNVVANDICPDEASSCPLGQTCCKMASGEYGCCPYSGATCCQDGEHCCPNGYHCDEAGSKCIRATGFNSSQPSVPMLKKIRAGSYTGQNTCPDGISSCDVDQTCCKLASGLYGCCPYPMAICCSDGQHCCPNGYTCNEAKQRCDSNWVRMDLKNLTSAKQVCPGGKQTCPADQTCCLRGNGQYTCCPHKNASLPDFIRNGDGDMPCPDRRSSCPLGSTCSKYYKSGFACCMTPNAVECGDGEHCCPENSLCDLPKAICRQANSTWIRYFKLRPFSARQALRVCPDHQISCREEETCCRNSQGHFQCCPFADAVCCPEKNGCCRQGETCADSGCVSLHKPEVLLQKLRDAVRESALTKLAADPIICPDKRHKCPAHSTCCMSRDKRNVTCCRREKAVCCRDGRHCCSNGFVCNERIHKCTKPHLFSWIMPDLFSLESDPTKQAEPIPTQPQWCDKEHKHRCKPHYTCCKRPNSTSFDCCPRENGVCCAVSRTCCPKDTKCSADGKDCYGGQFEFIQATTISEQAEEVVSQIWCPFGNNSVVCGAKSEYCCPEGTSCSLKTRQCMKKSRVIDLMLMTRNASAFQTQSATYAGCSACEKARGTCCEDSSCCPLDSDQAICCKDGFCCPKGSECLGQGKCRTQERTKLIFDAMKTVKDQNLLSDHSLTINQLDEDRFPARKNHMAFYDHRLMNGLYRVIKSTHWTICSSESQYFCPRDSICCPKTSRYSFLNKRDSFTCIPKGAHCIDKLDLHCPSQFKLVMNAHESGQFYCLGN